MGLEFGTGVTHFGTGVTGAGTIFIGVEVGVQLGGEYPAHVTQHFWSSKFLRKSHDARRNAKRKIPGTKRTALVIASPSKKHTPVYRSVTTIPTTA